MWQSQKLALRYMVGHYVILSVFVCLKIVSKIKSEKDSSTNHITLKMKPSVTSGLPSSPPLACSGPSGLLAGSPSRSCSLCPGSFPSNVCPLLTLKSQLKCPFFKGLSCSSSPRRLAPHLLPLSALGHMTAFSPFPFSLSEIFLLKIFLLCLLCYNAKRRS